MRKFAIGVTAAALALPLVAAPSAQAAAKPKPKPDLAKLVTAKDIKRHLLNLQKIGDYNGGNRKAGLAGYDISVKYVYNELKKAGLKPKLQNFPFWVFKQDGPGAFEQLEPNKATYKPVTEFGTYEYSGQGDVTGKVVPVDLDGPQDGTGNSGCEADDFKNFPKGAIALIRRGSCVFDIKASNAAAAGASATIIYQRVGADQPTDDPAVYGLSKPSPVPVIGTTYKIGNEMAASAKAGTLKVRVKTEVTNTPKQISNVIAESKYGNPNNVVVVGAHLDSVEAGPGVNDNGSGSSTILAAAQKINKLGKKNLKNKVRFAWWGAEESGLVGAEYYVTHLTAAQKAKIALNLNFDMTASPNGVRGVYNGSDPTAPAGSAAIQKMFNQYFAKRKLPTVPSEFNGRSDYGPFLEAGIPAGGVDTGAEQLKTAEEAKIFGGTAGQPYDACYHAKCDRITNINWHLLDTNADGIAAVIQRLALSTLPVNGQALKAKSAHRAPVLTYKGGQIVR
ncbi:M28 family peptidase [Actinomadura barringtoniae]|uniref:M28 family peptidase n=1 Tax=Actinomadura barringtoniae TaxID=1427535 RepID=A0A939PFC1_9ACTN|nr:M28 family peptidase [Actinomadura barringtoniae]MBO2448159.1 M28 family peptidase [Actinomadura barringtoniae]